MIREGYFGIDPSTASLIYTIPGEFVAYGVINGSGKVFVAVRNEESIREVSFSSLVQNNLFLRQGIESKVLEVQMLPKGIARKYERFMERGQDEKAKAQISSFCNNLFWHKYLKFIEFLSSRGSLTTSRFPEEDKDGD